MLKDFKRTRIKICGMTEVDEVALAVDLGVDAIGMILHANSPRLISAEQASTIRANVPAFVSLVGVFVNCPAALINATCEQVGLDLVQLHGDETSEFADQLNRPFIKAIRARTRAQVEKDMAAYPNARAILVDPYVKGQHGGTGQQLDASLWPQNAAQKVILAGGLSVSNVASAINHLNPFAVDFNSGLESAPGKKDPALIAQAINAVRAFSG